MLQNIHNEHQAITIHTTKKHYFLSERQCGRFLVHFWLKDVLTFIKSAKLEYVGAHTLLVFSQLCLVESKWSWSWQQLDTTELRHHWFLSFVLWKLSTFTFIYLEEHGHFRLTSTQRGIRHNDVRDNKAQLYISYSPSGNDWLFNLNKTRIF